MSMQVLFKNLSIEPIKDFNKILLCDINIDLSKINVLQVI